MVGFYIMARLVSQLTRKANGEESIISEVLMAIAIFITLICTCVIAYNSTIGHVNG